MNFNEFEPKESPESVIKYYYDDIVVVISVYKGGKINAEVSVSRFGDNTRIMISDASYLSMLSDMIWRYKTTNERIGEKLSQIAEYSIEKARELAKNRED